MGTANDEPGAPLPFASLPGLPEELCIAVVEQCDMPSIIAFSQTSHHFHRLANPKDDCRRAQMQEFLVKAQTFPRWQEDGFACFSCFKILPRNEFTAKQTKSPRGRNGVDQSQRFCIPCGVSTGRFRPGNIVKQGGSLRILCCQCKQLKGGRFCGICLLCTDCVRRHRYPCEERYGHNIIGDKLPRVETPQSVTAYQTSSRPSLGTTEDDLSDREVMARRVESPPWYAEWYDDE